jgi:hypothetical protein
MATLSLRQLQLAANLIGSGYDLKEFNKENMLKLNKGKTTIYIYPTKNKH